MSNKTLNDKLLEFVGLEYQVHELVFGNVAMPSTGYYLKGKVVRKTCPDLVNEVGMQSKYIHPKLIELKCYLFKGLIKPLNEDYFWAVTIHSNGEKFMGENKSEAIAFALAVEKLINSLEDNSIYNKDGSLRNELIRRVKDSQEHPENVISNKEMKKKLDL